MFRRILFFALLLGVAILAVLTLQIFGSQDVVDRVPAQPEFLFSSLAACNDGVAPDEPFEVGNGTLVYVVNGLCDNGNRLYIVFWDGGTELRWRVDGPFPSAGESPYVSDTSVGDSHLNLQIKIDYRDVRVRSEIYKLEPMPFLRSYRFIRIDSPPPRQNL